MSDLDVARSDLVAVALKITQETWTDPAAVRALCVAASAYDAARRAAAPQASRPKTDENDARHTLTLPFGRSKNKTIANAATDDLAWILPLIHESVESPEKARFRAKNEELADAIAAELETR